MLRVAKRRSITPGSRELFEVKVRLCGILRALLTFDCRQYAQVFSLIDLKSGLQHLQRLDRNALRYAADGTGQEDQVAAVSAIVGSSSGRHRRLRANNRL